MRTHAYVWNIRAIGRSLPGLNDVRGRLLKYLKLVSLEDRSKLFGTCQDLVTLAEPARPQRLTVSSPSFLRRKFAVVWRLAPAARDGATGNR